MSVLAFDGIDDQVVFTPISAALANLPNGAGTLVALVRVGDQGDICGLLDSADSGWYHVLGNQSGPARLTDDDGLASPSATTAFATQTAGAGNYQIVVVDWPAGGAALERFHWSSLVGTAESWTHDPSSANNGGNRAGPGTTGRFRIAGGSSQGPLLGEVALVAAWAGVRFTDTNVTDLWVNKKTSDWWNHSAGPPTLLTELNTLTPVDIGSAPSTLSTVIGATLTGADPTGWAFDGRGDAAPASLASPLLGMLRRGGLPRAWALRLLHPPQAAPSLVTVSDTRGIVYDLTGTTSATRAIKYDLTATVSATRAVRYDLLAVQSATRAVRYDLLELNSDTRAVKYDLLATTSATRAIKYDLVGTQTATRAVRYDIAQDAVLDSHPRGLTWVGT